MHCKFCGFSHPDTFPVCPVCGEWTVTVPPALPAPNRRRTRLPYLLLLGMVLIGCLLFFLIPMDGTDSANPPDGTVEAEGNQLFQKDCFLLEDGVLYFDESKFHANPILILPAAIDRHPVEIIGENCFANLTDVTTIILPSSIIQIRDRAFAGCRELRGLCVPNATESIGREAFQGCKSLEAVYLPTHLSSLGEAAFADCPRLQFIFYNGLYAQWITLCPDVVTPFTWVICWDGEYRHTGKTP